MLAASSWCKSKLQIRQILQIRRLCHRSHLVRRRRYYWSFNQVSSSPQTSNIMLFDNYDKRLTTFKKWFHTSSSSKTLIEAEFRHTFTKLKLNCITCRWCDLKLLNWELHDDFIKEHLRRSSECFKAKTAEEKEIIAAAVAIEETKSKVTVKNINFFDFIMQADFWKKFRISVNSASFLHHMIEFAVKYQEKSVLKTLKISLRDSALQWFKNQFIKFTSLNVFKTVIAKIFSFSAFASAVNFDQTIIYSSSPQYHRCSQCSMKFSSISRFLNHTQRGDCNKVTCKLCDEAFTSNNKLHEHVRQHHN